jgi:hypothetical protein
LKERLGACGAARRRAEAVRARGGDRGGDGLREAEG